MWLTNNHKVFKVRKTIILWSRYCTIIMYINTINWLKTHSPYLKSFLWLNGTRYSYCYVILREQQTIALYIEKFHINENFDLKFSNSTRYIYFSGRTIKLGCFCCYYELLIHSYGFYIINKIYQKHENSIIFPT